jgi:RND superfamily putative drug exporter
LLIPTGAETLRLQSYLVLCRNSRADYAELADLADAMNIDNAATVLAGIDEYYSSGNPHRMWIATQLVRRLADPVPADTADDDRWYTPDAAAQWDDVRTRCLSLAVATLEEAS